ncbi:MAG: type II secretion system F family protein [Phycisphaerales bacterium]
MPTFSYKSVGAGGGVIEAPDRADALRELLRRGETPASLEEVQHRAPVRAAVRAQHQPAVQRVGSAWMKRADLAMMVRELSVALKAGLPLVQALRTIARQGRKESHRRVLNSLIEQVEAGRPLSDAFAGWMPPFTELTVNLTRAGEASGKLGEVLGHAATLLDRDVKLRRTLLSATMYPMILAGLVVVAVIIVTTVIVPKILAQVGAQAAVLPWPTRVVQGFAHFFGSYWWLIVGVIGGAVLLFSAYYRSPKGRLSFDTFVLRLPLVGNLVRDVAVARFTRTLATLVNSGIPVVSGLRVTSGTLGNRAMEAVIDHVIEQVSAGKTIAQPMEESGYFPPMLVQIVNLGERSGRLDELLLQAADAFEDKTESSVKVFTAALPPILVVCLASVVGFVVLAILMALQAAQDAAMSG